MCLPVFSWSAPFKPRQYRTADLVDTVIADRPTDNPICYTDCVAKLGLSFRMRLAIVARKIYVLPHYEPSASQLAFVPNLWSKSTTPPVSGTRVAGSFRVY
jgi:hypothetical protein